MPVSRVLARWASRLSWASFCVLSVRKQNYLCLLNAFNPRTSPQLSAKKKFFVLPGGGYGRLPRGRIYSEPARRLVETSVKTRLADSPFTGLGDIACVPRFGAAREETGLPSDFLHRCSKEGSSAPHARAGHVEITSCYRKHKREVEVSAELKFALSLPSGFPRRGSKRGSSTLYSTASTVEITSCYRKHKREVDVLEEVKRALSFDAMAYPLETTILTHGLQGEGSLCPTQRALVPHGSVNNRIIVSKAALALPYKGTQPGQHERAHVMSRCAAGSYEKRIAQSTDTVLKAFANKLTRETHTTLWQQLTENPEEVSKGKPSCSPRKYYCWNRNPAARYPKKGNKGARPVCRAMRKIRKRLRTGR